MWVEIWIKCYFAKRKKKKCSLYHEGLWAQCGPLILWIHSVHEDEMIFIEALPCRHVVLAWWVMWNFSCCKMLHCQTFKMKWVCLLLNSNASSFHFHPPTRTSCAFCAQRLIAVHQNLYSPLPGPHCSSWTTFPIPIAPGDVCWSESWATWASCYVSPLGLAPTVCCLEPLPLSAKHKWW